MWTTTGIISAGYVEELEHERRERCTSLHGRESPREDQREALPGACGSSGVFEDRVPACELSALKDLLERSTQAAFMASLQRQELADLSRLLNQANSELCIYALSKLNSKVVFKIKAFKFKEEINIMRLWLSLYTAPPPRQVL